METTDNKYKVKFSHKTAVFIAASIALSWFFEGWRDIHKEGSLLIGWGILLGGTALTLLFLGVWAYWIYFEEKAKGTLKKRIQLFENIHSDLAEKRAARAAQKQSMHQKHDTHSHGNHCCKEQGESNHCG